MEQVGSIIKAVQSAGSNALTRPGTQLLPRDSVIHLTRMLRQMSAGMPHQEYGEETTEVFLMTFEDLALEFGVNSLEIALRSFLSRQSFFPHPSEVRKVLEEMAKRAKKEAEKDLPPLGCDACKDQGIDLIGYVMVTKPGRGRIVEDCQCRIRREQARKAMETKA